MAIASPSVSSRQISSVRGEQILERMDCVAIEEPLEIRLVAGNDEQTVTVTMRTPGADHELAAGFLIAERIVESGAQIESIRTCGTRANVVKVQLQAGVTPRLQSVSRNFASSSSCGLCGKTSLEAVTASIPQQRVTTRAMSVAPSLLQQLPDRLRASQVAFDATGGLHAVAAFDLNGQLKALHEDIGRHNALDKVIGTLIRAGAKDLSDCIVALSGRAGFEMIQKAAVVGVPMLVAIGAPSSLAVDLAEQSGMTLIGFLRAQSFNVYTHPARVAFAGAAASGEAVSG